MFSDASSAARACTPDGRSCTFVRFRSPPRATGWEGTTTGAGGSDLRVGPFGDGTNIAFHLSGFASFDGVVGEGPWTSDGTFSVTAGQ